MKIPKSRLVLLAAFAVSLGFFIFQMNLLPGIGARTGQQKGFNLLATLLDIIKQDYLEEADPIRTSDGAYRGLVNSLDALSCYLDKSMTERIQAGSAGTTDPGVVIFKRYNDFPQVRGVVSGSPAEKAGIRIGDVVSAIDGRDTLRMSLAETILNLQGTDATPVGLKVLRREDTLELSVPRALLHAKPFTFSQAESRPPVLTIHRFSPSLTTAVRKEVLLRIGDLRSPLIIDLRNCFSGEMEEARIFINLFVRAASIGSFGKKGGAKEKVACPAAPAAPDLPLLVWLGPGTMGPAELVSGVLQELGRAKTVGVPTLGLVAKQQFFPLKDGSSILLTSEVFSLPSGRLLWNEGIQPDTRLEGNDFGDRAYLERSAPFLAKR